MAPAAPATRRPWRWPLGWLFVLGLALGLVLWGWCAWLFLWVSSDHTGRYQWIATGLWPWLAEALWLAVAALGLLGLVMTVNNFTRRNWKRAQRGLLLAGLAAGHCAASFLPLVMAMGGAITLEVPKED